ncbi:MAG TPA: ATP-binding protein [Saprospiraceae bacterium]|nr:ATP-binding protein [Saprospiraceae bacterium]HPN68622.1 ATP-binding protein [Saprospiraceae bacterium]
MNLQPKKVKFYAFYLALLCLILSHSAFGQFKYETLSTAQGLSQGYIWQILQCKDGFLWMTTKAGLNRYDGYSFKVYDYDAFDPYTISNNATYYLYEDSKGRIWVGTDHGLNIFDKKTEKFYRLFHDPKDANSLSGNEVLEQITELADGRFLVNTSHENFDLVTIDEDFFENQKSIRISHIKKPKNSFNPGNYYNQVSYTDKVGRTWYKCDSLTYRLNEKTYQFELQKNINIGGTQIIKNDDGSVWNNDEYVTLYDGISAYPTFKKPIFNGHTGSILFEENGRLWRSNNNLGVIEIFDVSKWKKGNAVDPKESLFLTVNNVFANFFFKDKTGLVWVGLNGHGLKKYSFESEKFNHLVPNQSIKNIFADPRNNLYIRSWNGETLIDSKGKILNSLMKGTDPRVLDYFISKQGDLWITKRTDKKSGFISAIEKINPETRQVKVYKTTFKNSYYHEQHISEDKLGRLWIGGHGGAIGVFDTLSGDFIEFTINTNPKSPLSDDALITSIYHDKAGTVWIGTEFGFTSIENKNIFEKGPRITWYENNPDNKTSLNNNSVSSFLEDPINNQLLWIGTKGGGLNLMEKSTGKIRHITTQQGLCNNTVYGLLTDDSGNIWGSTNNGLFCILATKDRTADFEIRHFTEAAGLQDSEFNTNAYCKMPNGNLAFGGVSGLNLFNPKEILLDTFAPNIFITKLIVGNQVIKNNDETGILTKAIEFTESITLDHKQDVFTIEFSSLDFRAPDQIKYRYQLEGIDDSWIESGNRRNVSYSHLPAGNYTFRVQGSNSLGIWNNQIKALTIKILPPWYTSWYAYLFYLVLFGWGIKAYYQYKIDQNKMAAQLQFEQNESHRIKELDKIKTHLYTNITHEFRTPLTVILGMVQHIRKSASEHLENGLEMIERNGNNLLRLVNEMLDLSKLEAGKMELNLIQGDVINFIRYIVESFHSVAESQEKKMHYLSALDQMYVKYDEEKLRQIVSNLLSNALKFTSKKGDIYISITIDNLSQLVIKVKDTGKGISESQIHFIFDRFYQADTTVTRNAEGTGIGLALTKELVQLMDGEISVKSPPIGSKIGTEFTVTLPLDIIHDFAEESEKSYLKEMDNARTDKTHSIEYINGLKKLNSDKPLILLVEDNADVVAYTASCLNDYRLAIGKDGQEGFEIACDMVPDLIITDVMMPFMDGYEMTKRLRNDERTSHIPIIMLTAKADIDSKLEGIEYGAEVYLEKPFNVDELVLRVRKLLDQRVILQKAYASQMGFNWDLTETSNNESTTTHFQSIVIPTIENEFVRKVTTEIEAHLSDENLSVEQLAKNLFMSYSQVHRKLSAIMGMSPNQYIRILRLKKAKELLINTDDTILNISMLCGFSDPSYFGKVFKQEFGVSPHEWRLK